MQSNGPRQFLSRFRSEILDLGEKAAATIGRDGTCNLQYVPFETVNAAARLVLVGITPGNNQIKIAYRVLREALRSGICDADALAQAKSAGAFGGGAMRSRLNAMMHRFRIHELIGIGTPDEIWTGRRELLHATSVVPHAAFMNGRMFNGPFAAVLGSPLLRESFEQDFLPTLSMLPSSAYFIALGRVPLDALDWCVRQGCLRPGQLLGAFPHPSGSAGSQVKYFVGQTCADELDSADPVRHRLPWLDRARARLETAVSTILGAAPNDRTYRIGESPLAHNREDVNDMYVRTDADETSNRDTRETGLYAVVTRGAGEGTTLYPHLHKDGCFVVSPTRFKKDYIRVRTIEEVKDHLRRGYSLRMSNRHHPSHRAPSLISPGSILGWR